MRVEGLGMSVREERPQNRGVVCRVLQRIVVRGFGALGFSVDRCTSLMRTSPLLAPYSRAMPRALWWSYWGGMFVISEARLLGTSGTDQTAHLLLLLYYAQV